MILNLYPFVVFFAIPAVIIDFVFLPLIWPTLWIDVTYNCYLLLDGFINFLLTPWSWFMGTYVIIAGMSERPMYKNDLAAQLFTAIGLQSVPQFLSAPHY